MGSPNLSGCFLIVLRNVKPVSAELLEEFANFWISLKIRLNMSYNVNIKV